MSHSSLAMATLVLVLLATFVSPAAAVLPDGGNIVHAEVTGQFLPGGPVYFSPLYSFWINGGCEDGGNGDCPFIK